MHCC